jgi:acyl-CoA synthetase (NDP forming)
LPGDGLMLEPQAMAWLKENGIPVPEFYLATSADEAVRACENVGYPAVMKVVSPDILHKSDVGGVVVGIRNARAARKAFETIRQSAQGKVFCGAIVYPMTLSNFSRLPFLYPEIGEVDLNPVFLLPKGLLVGDVRVIKKQGFVIQQPEI